MILQGIWAQDIRFTSVLGACLPHFVGLVEKSDLPGHENAETTYGFSVER